MHNLTLSLDELQLAVRLAPAGFNLIRLVPVYKMAVNPLL